MKKQIIIFGIVVLFICVGLSGCFGDENNISEQDYFIGKWIDTDYRPLEGENNPKIFTRYIYFKNGSALWSSIVSDDTGFNYTTFSWLDYSIRDGKLYIEGEAPNTGQLVEMCFKYEFFNDYKQLRLEECDDSSAVYIINKIE